MEYILAARPNCIISLIIPSSSAVRPFFIFERGRLISSGISSESTFVTLVGRKSVGFWFIEEYKPPWNISTIWMSSSFLCPYFLCHFSTGVFVSFQMSWWSLELSYFYFLQSLFLWVLWFLMFWRTFSLNCLFNSSYSVVPFIEFLLSFINFLVCYDSVQRFHIYHHILITNNLFNFVFSTWIWACSRPSMVCWFSKEGVHTK